MIVNFPVASQYLAFHHALAGILATRPFPPSGTITLDLSQISQNAQLQPAPAVAESPPSAAVAAAPAPKPKRKWNRNVPAQTAKWSPDMAARAYRESDAPMRAILALLSSQPGVPFTSKEIGAAAKCDGKALRSVLGAFGNRLVGYGLKGKRCFARVWDRDAGGALYTMHDADLAQAIQQEIAKKNAA